MNRLRVFFTCYILMPCFCLAGDTVTFTPGEGQSISFSGLEVRIGGWLDLIYLDPGPPGDSLQMQHAYLFFDTQISPKWRAMLEFSHVDAQPRRGVPYQKDQVERAYFEYRHGIPLKFRFGKFNTPAGLWKQIQWSIMVDTNRKPLIEEMRFIPGQVTGAAVLGKANQGRVEMNYEIFAARGDGMRQADQGRDTSLNFGGDFSLTFSEWVQVGIFVNNYPNPGTGGDLVVGERTAWLSYKEVQLVPGRLLWRSEFLHLKRENVADLEGFYSKLKWQWSRSLFFNYRFDRADVLEGFTTTKHDVNTATVGYWPKKWLRFRLEFENHHLRGRPGQGYNEWSLWTGVLF